MVAVAVVVLALVAVVVVVVIASVVVVVVVVLALVVVVVVVVLALVDVSGRPAGASPYLAAVLLFASLRYLDVFLCP